MLTANPKVPGKSWSFSEGLALDWQSIFKKWTMSRMTYMRSWKSHRLTSHTWLGLNPQIGRLLLRIYFFIYDHLTLLNFFKSLEKIYKFKVTITLCKVFCKLINDIFFKFFFAIQMWCSQNFLNFWKLQYARDVWHQLKGICINFGEKSSICYMISDQVSAFIFQLVN
jgi:hypothetical protein